VGFRLVPLLVENGEIASGSDPSSFIFDVERPLSLLFGVRLLRLGEGVLQAKAVLRSAPLMANLD